MRWLFVAYYLFGAITVDTGKLKTVIERKRLKDETPAVQLAAVETPKLDARITQLQTELDTARHLADGVARLVCLRKSADSRAPPK